jgi:eukaryotic-like serine/threonine-protein kinase
MLTDRWHEIESLYHSACERKLEERQAYLEEACRGDESLRREVESLLACDDVAATFLETDQIDSSRKEQLGPSVPAGERIGPVCCA